MVRLLMCVGLVMTVGAGAFAATKEDAAVKSIADDNNVFAAELYARLSAGGGNLFFSPHSIHTALAMTYAGAKGQTAEQMARTMHYSLESPKLHPAYAALLKQLNEPRRWDKDRRTYELVAANALWPARNYRFHKEYVDLVQKNYLAGVQELDYAGAREQAAKVINAWVEKQTRNKIRNLVSPDALSAMTRLVLTNAIYFKSAWANEFKKEATRDQPFHLSADRTVDVPTMKQTRHYGHMDGDGFRLVHLPYLGGELGMDVIVPKEVAGLAAVEKAITAENLAKWSKGIAARKIELHLPKFRIEAQFQLAQVLAQMGMPDAFDVGKADFSGMTTAEKLFISAIIHKAFVDVNEEGTEAAAATVVMMGATAMPIPEEPLVVKVDRPFVFAIRHRASGAVLFMGRVANPKG